MKVATPELLAMTNHDEHASTWTASGFAMIGEVEAALKLLEHANAKGFFNYPLLAEYDPFLANIRREPRFKTLMAKVKRQWESFEV